MLAYNVINRAGGQRGRECTYGLQRKRILKTLKKKIRQCRLHDFTVYGALGALPESVIKGDSSHRNCGRDGKPCQISAV